MLQYVLWNLNTKGFRVREAFLTYAVLNLCIYLTHVQSRLIARITHRGWGVAICSAVQNVGPVVGGSYLSTSFNKNNKTVLPTEYKLWFNI